MWGQLGKVAAAAKAAAQTVASEAAATVAELRDVHQDEWARRREGQGAQLEPPSPPPAAYSVQQAGPFSDGPALSLEMQLEADRAPILDAPPQPWHVQPHPANGSASGGELAAVGQPPVPPPAPPPGLVAPLITPQAKPQVYAAARFPSATAKPPQHATAPHQPPAAARSVISAASTQASDVSSRLAALKAKLQADKTRAAPISRTGSTAGSSLSDTPRQMGTSAGNLPDMAAAPPAAAPVAPASVGAAETAAFIPTPALPTDPAVAVTPQDQDGSLASLVAHERQDHQRTTSASGQHQQGGWEAGSMGSVDGPLFHAYQPAHADHQPVHQHPSWLPKPVPFHQVQHEQQQRQPEQGQREEQPVVPIPFAGALDASTTGAMVAEVTEGRGSGSAAAQHADAPNNATAVEEAGAGSADHLAELQKTDNQTAGEAAGRLQEVQAELERERRLVAALKEQLQQEQQQHAATSSSLVSMQHQAEELSAVCEADKATLAELAEQLAAARLAAAQLEEERLQHQRTQEHLAQLQELHHNSADRSKQLTVVVAELQEQLAAERDARQAVEERLAAAEQHVLEVRQAADLGHQQQQEEQQEVVAARDAFWQQHLAEQQAALQAALAEQQRLAAELDRQRQRAEQGDAVAAAEAEVLAARQEAETERAHAEQLQRDLSRLQAALQQEQAAVQAAAVTQGRSAGEVAAELEGALRDSAALRQEIERLQQQQQQAVAAASASESLASELQQRVSDLEAALAASEADRAGQRAQLARLKQQMLSEQEDEEDKIRWRVEAEVKMELEKLRASGGAEAAGCLPSSGAEELAAAKARCAALEGDVSKWEAALAARDVELQNLQRALGELSYESEAAERLRGELRGQQAEAHALRNELDAARLQHMRLQEEAAAAQAGAAAAQQQLQAARDAEGVLQAEALSLRRALADAQRKLHALSSDSGAMIDRRIVVKMLVAYFEKQHSGEVLELMCNMLGFSAEDRAKIAESQRRQGWRDISLAADVSLPHGQAGAKPSLAASWVDFLEQQVEGDAAGASHADSNGVGGSSSSPGATNTAPATDSQQQQQQPAPPIL